MADVSMVLTLAANGLLVAAVAAVAIPTRALPRWLGWGTAITALALFANVALARGQSFLPAMLLFMLWVLVTSIVLIRQAGAAAAPATTPPMREPALAR